MPRNEYPAFSSLFMRFHFTKLKRAELSILAVCFFLLGISLIDSPNIHGQVKAEKNPQDPHGDVPHDYRGPAIAKTDPKNQMVFTRINKLFEEKKWNEGLELIDETLSRTISPQSEEEEPEPEPEPEASDEDIVGGGWVGGNFRAFPIFPGFFNEEEVEDEVEINVDLDKIQTLVHSDDGIHYLPVVDYIRHSLEKLPTEGQQVYQATYHPPAKLALNTALKISFLKSIPELRKVHLRYPLTLSGRLALEHAANRSFDVGLIEQAKEVYNFLISTDEQAQKAFPEEEDQEQLLSLSLLHLKVALCSVLLDEVQETHSALKVLEEKFADAIFTLGGQPLSGHQLREHALFKRTQDRSPTSEAFEWTGPTGRQDQRSLNYTVDSKALLGAKAEWVFPFEGETPEEKDTKPPSIQKLLQSKKAQRTSFISPPIHLGSQDGYIVVRYKNDLYTLEAKSGKVAWQVQVHDGKIQQPTNNYYYYSYRSKPHSRSSSVTLAKGSIIVIDTDGFPNYRKTKFTPNKIVAYDLKTGKIRWHIGGEEEEDPILKSFVFVSPPAPLKKGGWVAPAIHNNAVFLIGLSEKGKKQWITRLHDFGLNNWQAIFYRAEPLPSLTIDGDLATCSLGMGIVSQVNTLTGKLRWWTRYRSSAHVQFNRFKRERLISVGDAIVCTPLNSKELFVLDKSTGKTLWRKNIDNGQAFVLGADEKRIYWGNKTIQALSLTTGEPIYETPEFDGLSGGGFVTNKKIFVAVEEGLVVLDKESGKEIQKLGWIDSRFPSPRPGNLALTHLPEGSQNQHRLVISGKWGIALVEPLETTRKTIEEAGDRKFLEKARLLAAEGKFEESFKLGEKILSQTQSEITLAEVKAVLADTALNSTSQQRPDSLKRLLQLKKIKWTDDERLSLNLEMGLSLEELNPQQAFEHYTQLLKPSEDRSGNSSFLTPFGSQTQLKRYLLDSLVHLQKTNDFEPETHSLPTKDLQQLSDRPSNRHYELKKFVFENGHDEKSAEALAYLIALTLDRGDLIACHGWLNLLTDRFPESLELEEIQELKQALAAHLEVESSLPSELLAQLKTKAKEDLSWKEITWKSLDQGFLVETTETSDPLPWVLSIYAGNLHFTDTEGNLLGKLELPEYPDVEKAKAGLKSHLEEPGKVFFKGSSALLFTAAGIYQILIPQKNTTESDIASDEGTDSKDEPSPAKKFDVPKIGWRHNYDHELQKLYQNQAGRGWSRSSLNRVSGNLFPRALFEPSKNRVLVSQTDGSLTGFHLESGKMILRSDQHSGKPTGTFLPHGDRVVTMTLSPSGLLIRRPDFLQKRLHTKETDTFIRLDEKNKNLMDSQIVPGHFAVFTTTTQTEVIDLHSQKSLWTLPQDQGQNGPIARATSTEIWIVTRTGKLQSRTAKSGRLLWEITIPPMSLPKGVYEFHSENDSTATYWALFASESSSTTSTTAYRATFTQSGKKLHFIKLNSKGEKIEEVSIGENGVTLRNSARRVGNKLYLNLNLAEENQKWSSQWIIFDLETGKLESQFSHEIANKGTGMYPKIAFVKDHESGKVSIAMGNSEGFGLYRLEKNQAEAEESGEEKLDANTDSKTEKHTKKNKPSNTTSSDEKPAEPEVKIRVQLDDLDDLDF